MRPFSLASCAIYLKRKTLLRTCGVDLLLRSGLADNLIVSAITYRGLEWTGRSDSSFYLGRGHVFKRTRAC